MIIHFAVIVALSFLVGLLGRRRKFGFWGYFFGSILLTPVVGLLLVLASDPRQAESGEKEKDAEDAEEDAEESPEDSWEE